MKLQKNVVNTFNDSGFKRLVLISGVGRRDPSAETKND
jgi:hypothetical protein